MDPKFRIFLLLVLVIAAVSVGPGCLGNQPSDQTDTVEGYTMDGKVVDAQTGDPVSGVVIRVDEHSTKTGPEGSFQIDNLQAGNYTVKAEKPDYYPRETEVSINFDNKVRIQIRSEEYFKPNASSLLATHWDQGITCDDCHGESTVEDIQSSPTNETCIECHSLAGLQNRTSTLDPNPHKDPHDMFKNCMNCHRVHEPSVKRCAKCHSSDIIPEVP